MFIHVGGDISLSDRWIIAILDFDAVTTDPRSATRDFLTQAEADNRLEWIGQELPRSLILTMDRQYLSPVRAETLRQRWAKAGRRTSEGED